MGSQWERVCRTAQVRKTALPHDGAQPNASVCRSATLARHGLASHLMGTGGADESLELGYFMQQLLPLLPSHPPLLSASPT